MPYRNAFIAVIIAGVILAAIIIASQLIVLNDAGRNTIAYEVGAAESVRAVVDLPISVLTVEGGATQLVEGEINFGLPAFELSRGYSVIDGEGALVIAQPPTLNGQNNDLADFVSRLAFNNEVPLSLSLTQERGSVTMDASALSLSALDTDLGDGADSITLNGTHPTMTALNVATGGASDTITVNCDCPSLLESTVAAGGENDQVELRGTYPTLTNLSLDAGAGDDAVIVEGDFPNSVSSVIRLGGGSDALTLSGNFNPSRAVIVDIGTGDDVVTIGDSWTQNLNLTVISEGDSAALSLPSSVGVYVETASRSNTVIAEGFTQEGAAYVNEAYGVSDITLLININTTPNEVITLTLR